MKLGIVGLPNVGKSTLFNAITNAGAESANYPFCTIEPNVGVVSVPDSRLDWLADFYQPKKKTPAVIEFVDIAGLVKGASKGEGLGNKFLENIRRTDAIVHVVRCFDDENVIHVEGSTDPIRDIDIIDLELIMADMEMVDRRIDKASKAAKSGDKKMRHEVEVFEALKAHLDEGRPARSFEADEDDLELIATSDLLTLKPVIYAANTDEGGIADLGGNKYYQAVLERAEAEGAEVLPICAKTEQELTELSDEDKAMFLEELGLEDSGLDRLVKCSPPARTSAARGLSARAPRLRRLPERSTPTLSAASSARRSSPLTISRRAALWSPRRRRDLSAPRARSTLCRTAT